MKFTKLNLVFIFLFFITYLQPLFSQVEKDLSEAEPLQIQSIAVDPSVRSGKTEEVILDTRVYKVTFQAKGGLIKEFLHKSEQYESKNGVNLTELSPFSFVTYSSGPVMKTLQNAKFSLELSESGNKKILHAKLPLIVTAADGKKYKILYVKEYVYFADIHFWEFNQKFVNESNVPLRFSEMYFLPLRDMGPAPDEKSPRAAQTVYNFIQTQEKFEKKRNKSGGFGFFNSSKDEEAKQYGDNVEFFGKSGRFMLTSVQPLFKNKGAIYFPQVKRDEVEQRKQQIHLVLGAVSLPANSEVSFPYLVYTGPKLKKLLKAENAGSDFPYKKEIHENLYKAYDFGITAPIRDLIVVILHFFYRLIPNYGVGIILFTLLFKLAFFQINQKQAESMKKMAALQPLMKEINEKYKDNAQEKQRRLMLLYKEHKVNPLGGCLPMVIQIPIFIALYSAFSDSYDLWKSPFISGWISDLSEPDILFSLPGAIPYLGGFHIHILPLLMALTQFLQTKFTVVSGDENQKRIMQFMPLLMLFFFWKMPAGVVLYWTVQNIFSIAQQLYTNSRESTESIKTPAK